MTSTYMNLLAKTTYSYPAKALSTVAHVIPAALAINVLPYREGTLIVRFHEAPIWSPGAELTVGLHLSAPTSEDPSKIFRAPTALLSVITKESGGLTFPHVGNSTATSGLGGLVDLLITIKPATAADLAYTVVISVDLALKS